MQLCLRNLAVARECISWLWHQLPIGVSARLKMYHDESLMPVLVTTALGEGYTITHKGLLCWTRWLQNASKVPVYRLLFIALEAAFSYMFWTMKARKSDYGMGYICLWDRHTLEYDRCCTHCDLNEGIRGHFDLTAEQLEARAVEAEQKRLLIKAENATNHHYHQMATNYDEYITAANERVYKSRANNPGRDAAHQARRIEEALSESTFVCELCDLSFGTKQRLDNHKETAKHLRKHKESSNPFRCRPCNLGFHNQSNLTRHNLSVRHSKAVAAASSSSKLD